jgi:hypothetical protein
MRLRNLIGGIALALFSLIAAPQAFAQTDPCAGPFPGPSVNITKTGDCNITQAINVSGPVTITVTGGTLTTQGITSAEGQIDIKADSVEGTTLSAGTYIRVQSTVGSLNYSGSITANTVSTVSNVIALYSQTTLATGSISNPPQAGGYVDIWANLGGGSSLFTIGGTGNSNGINGTISTNGAGNALLVQNGTANSTGGITLASMSAINLTTTNMPTGFLWMNANKGTITLPSGTLSVDGQGNYNSGSIALIANTISAPSGATLSASQSTSAPQANHSISLAAANINFGGSNGLTVKANGNNGALNVYPAGALTVNDNLADSNPLIWGISTNYNQPGSITFNGSRVFLKCCVLALFRRRVLV